MNTMADGAEQRLDAQIAEALFGQPGMSKMDVANRVRELRGNGPALLVDGQTAPAGQIDAETLWWLQDAINTMAEGGNQSHVRFLQRLHDTLSAQPSPGGQDALLGYVRVEAITALREDDEVTGVMVHVEERADSVPVYLAARQPVNLIAQKVGDYRVTVAEDSITVSRGRDIVFAYSAGDAEPINARQPVGEPVAWLLISEAGTAIGATRHARERESWEAAGGTTEPLYATPRVQDVDGYLAAFYELADMLGIPAQPCSPKEVWETQMRPALQAAIAAQGPLPMVLHCPRCHLQHIDAPDERTPDWKNPPHRSHLCHGCGLIWRPADVPTIGVDSTRTAGKSDTPFVPMLSTRPVACLLLDKNGVLRRTRPFTADGKYVFDAATLARLNEGNPQLAPFKAKLVYAGPTTHPADLREYRDAVMHAYGIVEPDEYYEKLGELLDLIDSQAVGK